jgi:transposase
LRCGGGRSSAGQRSKNCARDGQIIVFIDKSGLSERPHRVHTGAHKGQIPMLQYSFSWKQLSAISGVSFWNIYFRLLPGAVRAPAIVAFLKALRRHLHGRKLLIVWDRLQEHRSRLVRDYVESQGGAIQIEFLPPYVPELNPIECIWSHWRHHELANFCPRDFAELSPYARAKRNHARRRWWLTCASRCLRCPRMHYGPHVQRLSNRASIIDI